MREEEGQCLLRIVISRQERSTASSCYKARAPATSTRRPCARAHGRALRAAAGRLSPPQLNIMAYFRYTLSRRIIYGERP